MNSIRSKRWRIVQSDCINHFTRGILRRGRSYHSGRRGAGDVGETMKVDRVDKIVRDFVIRVES